jgi:hypothetical protein
MNIGSRYATVSDIAHDHNAFAFQVTQFFFHRERIE